jgi:hypothetical protein
VRASRQSVVYERVEGGYEAMWRHAHALALGREPPLANLDALVADLNYALDIADGVDTFLGVTR